VDAVRVRETFVVEDSHSMGTGETTSEHSRLCLCPSSVLPVCRVRVS